MKSFLFVAAIIASHSFARAEEITDFIEMRGPVGAVDPRKVFAMTDPEIAAEYNDYYIILNYNKNYIDAMIGIALQVNPSGEIDPELPQMAIHDLSTIAGHDHEALPFEKIKALVEKLESMATEDNAYLWRLKSGYRLMANSGYPQALEFLEQRASFEFWQDKKMPMIPDGGRDAIGGNAQEEAIGALFEMGSPEAEAFLRKCLDEPRYSIMPFFGGSPNAIIATIQGESAYTKKHKILLDRAWAKRAELLKANGDESTPQVTTGTVAAVATKFNSSSAQPKAVETSASRDAAWFILGGAVIILAGGYILIRRK